MKHSSNSYVSNRVLKLNVGFLLADGPSHNHDTAFDVPTLRVAEDLTLEYLRGPVRLSRTKEGILVQGQLEVGLTDECVRCLDPVSKVIPIHIEELFTYPPSSSAEFSIKEDAILDLGPLVRAEALIVLSRGSLCRPDCKGLCPNCGANLNDSACDCASDEIDPRLAQLREMLDTSL